MSDKRKNKNNATKAKGDDKRFTLSDKIAIIDIVLSIIVACISIYVSFKLTHNSDLLNKYSNSLSENANEMAEDINKVTKENFNLNYKLTPSYLKPAMYNEFSSGGTLFNLAPNTFTLQKDNSSGEYSRKYFAVTRKNDVGELIIDIREFDESNSVYYIDHLSYEEEKAVHNVEVERNEDKNENNEELVVFYSNQEMSDFYIFHVILEAKNGSYQFFTALNYDKTLNESESTDLMNIYNFKTRVISGLEIYNNYIMDEVFNEIDQAKYKNYRDLLLEIESQRKFLKEKMDLS